MSDNVTPLFEARCPVCGDRIDYCQGHGLMGDPTGWTIMTMHQSGEHNRCHPSGCDDALAQAKARHPSSTGSSTHSPHLVNLSLTVKDGDL